ncbi:MAG TPA: type II secretion system major pseudopilin GspG [Verrucomicrobiae bacterium]|nr:type II secretion system major pseudopilin GspG [Verrucomicrobiae bacterium]
MKTQNLSTLKNRKKHGFTLVEILLVVTIIGILAALVIPKIAGKSDEARKKAAFSDVNGGIKTALGMYEVDTGRYPNSLNDLFQQPSDVKGWKGPYLDAGQIPMDPWGHAYVYVYPGRKNPSGYDLYSVGPDDQDGTADDIGNWMTSADQ